MLFNNREREAIARGELTLAYRHWKRPQAKPGARHRLAPFGMIDILDLEADPFEPTDADAIAAGFQDAAALQCDIDHYAGRYPGNTLYRVRFRFIDAPDPRAKLAADHAITPGDLAMINEKLDRMDARSPAGPWTRQTLRLIKDHPERRAGDLAAMLGRERLEFKRDVRKLKALGLTVSLGVGYQLSPRGRTFIDVS
jgi:hypothetical protein